MNILRVLFIGDVIGVTGRVMFKKHIDALKEKYKIDATIVNGENSATQGRGITPRVAKFFKDNGVDVITTGNHIWYKREIYSYLEQHTHLLRPANFPTGSPGIGMTTFLCKNYVIGIMNIQGRVFMRDLIDCPFRTAKSILSFLQSKTNLIFIDFHAEATSEKMAMAYLLDGRISGLVGTHTHIQTADERVLPGGTAYITDLGMVGSLNSMLGMKKDAVIEHFLVPIPVRFSVDTSLPVVLCGAIIEVDVDTGKATRIERIQLRDNELSIEDGKV